MAGEFLDYCVCHALNEKCGSRKMPQVMDAEIMDFGEIADSSETLTKIPSMRSGKLLNVLKSDIRLGRKQIFMLSVAWKPFKGINDQPGRLSDKMLRLD